MVAVFDAWSMPVTFAVTTLVVRRWRRCETTAWRGSMDPETTSGRNGWYVMYGSGSTMVTSASPDRRCDSSFHAV